MSRYVILIPGNEAAWEAASPEEHEATYAQHGEFARLLAARGHKIVDGAELVHSRHARTVRGGVDDMIVTEGPYAESVEQLTGFYLIDSDDLDDLVQTCGVLTGVESAVEVRGVVDHSGDPAAPQTGS